MTFGWKEYQKQMTEGDGDAPQEREPMICPECGSEMRCRYCQGFCANCHNLELQCGIAVSLYTLAGTSFGDGYCSDFLCKCGHEDKLKDGEG